MSAKKLLLLSVSAGAGHARAAEALRVAAEAHYGVEALHLDVMNHVTKAFRKLYTDWYLRLVDRYPALWAQLYRITNETPPDAPGARLRRAIERLNARDLRNAIAAFAPDRVICTHFLPAELLLRERERGRLAAPVFVQVTDFDLHALWEVPHMAGYFAASDEVAYRMRARGLPDERVHVTGIPIMPAFGEIPDRAECARELGLDPTKLTLLLMGGGAGVGALDDAAATLLSLDLDVQVIALAGRNAAMLEKLQALAQRHPGKLLPHGYTNRIERLMGAADVAISKPGGLTTSECLALGLPMIVFAPIPGQEERNCDYLLEHGAALKAVDATALEYRVRQLAADPSQLVAMRANARRLGTPKAARAVLDRVLG
jgi:processive 1,2-diacylglycerol beta-glucosyltransferase